LHRPWVNAKTLGDAVDTFTSALTLVQGCLDLLLKLGAIRGRPSRISRRSIRWPRALFMGEAVGAVVLVTAKKVRLSIWACAWRRQWVAAEEALEFWQGFPGWRQGFPGSRSVAYRSGAPSGLDWRRAGPRFAQARRDRPLSDVAAPGRSREWALSRARSAQPLPLASPTRTVEQQRFRDRPTASSSRGARPSPPADRLQAVLQ